MELVLHDKQKEIARDTHRFRVLCCGRRWGKTTLAIDQMKGRAAIPESRIAYIAPTFQQARDIAWEQLKTQLRDAAVTINESRLEIKLVNNSLIILRGWEAIETLRGQSFDLIILDEVAMMRKFWMNWQEVVRPTLTDRRGEAIFVSTPKGFNHFYDLYNMYLKDDNFTSFRSSSYDNPYIPNEEIDAVKNEVTPERFAQEYMADFTRTEGLVYKEFNREQHIFYEQELVYKEIIAGVDFGFTNPCAVLSIGVSSDDTYWVFDEYYKTGKTDSEVAQYVAASQFNAVYPDPAAAAAIEELRKSNVNVQDVIKGKDSIKNGIDRVRSLFKANKLKIHSSCINTIGELETYSYPDSKQDRNESEVPIDDNNHACFAAGTLVDGKQIEKIGTYMGDKEVYEYKLGDTTIKSTPDHPVLTHRGLVPIDAIRYDDVIWQKQLFMTAIGGVDIRTVVAGTIGCTINGLVRILQTMKRNISIDTYGNKKTDQYLKNTIYIMLMVIPLIIRLITSSVFTSLNTVGFILRKKSDSLLEKMFTEQLKVPQSGVKLLKDRLSEKKVVKKMHILCTIYLWLRSCVIYVEKNTIQSFQKEVGSATLIAEQKHYVGHVPVYNLITRNGMYRANGIVVSNCDALRYALMMHSHHGSYGDITITLRDYEI